MKLNVDGNCILLDDSLCKQYKEKLLYDITPDECKVYAESYFDKPFHEVVKSFPLSSVSIAIENAMREEISL